MSLFPYTNKKRYWPLIQGLFIAFLFFSFPTAISGQAGNTITFSDNSACGTMGTLIFLDTDATGRHRYQNAVAEILCEWDNGQQRWEFRHTGFNQVITSSTFASLPNPPDAATGGYTGGEYFGQDCTTNGLTISGTGTQNFLPITLSSFIATPKNKEIQLEWTTATEVNNAFMVIERSHDAKAFIEIGRVEGIGDSNTLQNYSLMDKTPFNGINYYRLKQIDFDGRSTYHPIVTANLVIDDVDVQLFPNPMADQVNIRLAQTTPNNINIKVFNSFGQVVKLLSFPSAENAIDFELSDLPKGQYTLQIHIEQQNIIINKNIRVVEA